MCLIKKHFLRLTLLAVILHIPFTLSNPVFGQCGTPPPSVPDTSGTRGGTQIPTWNPLNPTDTITVNCVVILVDFPDDNTDSGNPVWPTEFDPTEHPWQTSIGWSPNYRPPHPDMMADIIDISTVNPGPTGKKMEHYNVLPGYELRQIQPDRTCCLSASPVSVLLDTGHDRYYL